MKLTYILLCQKKISPILYFLFTIISFCVLILEEMTSLKNAKLECKLVGAGKKLLDLSLVASTQPIELLMILDDVQGLLSQVEQAPSRSMKDALHPSMKALISHRLFKHSCIDVQVSVASCMSELIRITAPNTPYGDDVQMKDIFQLIVMALGMLSSENFYRYVKALNILGNMTCVRACVLMVDSDCDELICEMFKLFLSTIRYPHSGVVFRQFESIMTQILKEIGVYSRVLLRILLHSIDRKAEHPLSRPWMLAEKVIINCASSILCLLQDMFMFCDLNFDDYSPIVEMICLQYLMS